MPDAPAASRANEKKHTSVVTTGSPKTIRHFLRDGFNGFLRALPGVHDVLVTVIGAMQSILANLAPAKGRQNHTTSPSASRHSSAQSSRLTRPASIASRPTF